MSKLRFFQSGLQQDYELGAISSDEFASRVADSLNVTIAANDVWLLCSDIFSLNASIVPIVTHLASAGYPLGILSNTCEAHWKHIENQSYTILRELFSIRVLSYEERLAKPNPEIFKLAADRASTTQQRSQMNLRGLWRRRRKDFAHWRSTRGST